MPVIHLFWDELERLVEKSRDEILDRLPLLGCDIERMDEETVDIEFFPNRPDLYSIEGVARALRGFMDVEKGYRQYEVKSSDWELKVEPPVFEVRPRIVCCVVRNIRMKDEVIRSLMDVQEDLHWTIGRNRRKMAIGVHDLSKVYFPLRYTAVDRDYSFVPLDFHNNMSVGEILTDHPKGKDYSFILEGKDKFPMIIDSKDEAISFPPVINAEKTRVTEGTTDLFIDVTGFDENVDKALNILTSMLADRGGVLEEVKVIYPDRSERTPDLTGKEMNIDKQEVEELLGFELSGEEIKDALEKMRFGTEVEVDGDSLKVMIPAYRADVLHEWDVIEDIGIGYGYDRIEPEYPPTTTIGLSHKWNDVKDVAREIMTGLGYMEVISFTLTNEKMQYQKMLRETRSWEHHTPVMHPITEDHTILRTDILPKLLEILSMNKHYALPQRIFEAGDAIIKMENCLKLSACTTHSKANFAEVRSLVQSFMKELDVRWEVEESDDGAFISGRRASIIVNGKEVGVFGELHPQVLNNFYLSTPVAGMEINLSAIFDTGKVL
ncbi:MAG: phenylalanine--tRNA ligase subunit beta [Archaeoglobaceae archaeon]